MPWPTLRTCSCSCPCSCCVSLSPATSRFRACLECTQVMPWLLVLAQLRRVKPARTGKARYTLWLTHRHTLWHTLWHTHTHCLWQTHSAKDRLSYAHTPLALSPLACSHQGCSSAFYRTDLTFYFFV